MIRSAIIAAVGGFALGIALSVGVLEWRKPESQATPKVGEQLQQELRRTQEILEIVDKDRLRAWGNTSAMMRRYCGYIDHVAAIIGNPLMACLDSMAVVARAAGWTPPKPWEPAEETQRSRGK